VKNVVRLSGFASVRVCNFETIDVLQQEPTRDVSADCNVEVLDLEQVCHRT
jgi:hypothetical protein